MMLKGCAIYSVLVNAKLADIRFISNIPDHKKYNFNAKMAIDSRDEFKRILEKKI